MPAQLEAVSIAAGSLNDPVPGIVAELGIDAYETQQPLMTVSSRRSLWSMLSERLPTLVATNTALLIPSTSIQKKISVFRCRRSLGYCIYV